MFRGINAINLDAKGRISIPTRYRDRLSEEAEGKMVITIDTESPCLLLYPLGEWEMIEKKLEALPSFNPAARRIQRLLIGHAHDVDMDANGRLLVPNELREYANLSKGASLIGQGRKFELWSDADWKQGREKWLEEEAKAKAELPPELSTLSL